MLSVRTSLSALVVIFLLFFPKGGVKIVELPITWGYLLLVTLAPFQKLSLSKKNLIPLFALIPFQIALITTHLLYGTENLGYTISLFLGFFLFPWLFCGTQIARYADFNKIRAGILFVAVYGIFLFFYKLKTGHFFEIPYLTINGHDAGQLGFKSIERGDFFKLISTYNNGIIYGVCLLMLLPLYQVEETNRLKIALVKLSLLLTLSRTVWAGLLFYELISPFFIKRAFPFLKLSVIVLGLLGLSMWMGFGRDFFFDLSFGGRIGQLELFKMPSLFGNGPFVEVKESVYFGILESFGLFGFFTFLIAMSAPLLLKGRKELQLGLISYLFISLSDGALLFIPTLAFFWFLVGYQTLDQDSLLCLNDN